jgi:hypothetical protein
LDTFLAVRQKLDFGHFFSCPTKKFFEKRQTGCNLMVWKIKKKLPVLPRSSATGAMQQQGDCQHRDGARR